MKRSITYKKLLCLMGVPVFALSIALMAGCGDDGDDPTTSASPTKIYMFSSGTDVDGKLGGDGTNGRTAADALCSANKPSGVSISTVHAYLSVSSSDTIANMPTTYSFPNNIPIYGPNDTSLVGNNWADLLDTLIPDTLQNLGVVADGSSYWTGSNADGTLHTYSCTGWTTNSSGEGGRLGLSTVNDDTYLSNSQTACNTTRKVLCIGY